MAFSLLDNLFLNLSLLITLLFLNHQIFKKHPVSHDSPPRRKILFGLALGVIGVILMHYTIQTPNILVDLRHLAPIIAAIYGGPLATLVTAAVISLGRYLMFPDTTATLLAIVNMLLIGNGCALISRTQLPGWKKWLYMNLLGTAEVFLVFYLLIRNWSVLRELYVDYFIAIQIGMFVTMLLCGHLTRAQELFDQYQRDSTRDALTGLHNVRQFDTLINDTLRQSVNARQPMSLLLVDIDHFKQVNDTHGHPAGDIVLREVGGLLRDTAGPTNPVSRNGGEEFSVILPASTREQALDIAERIRGAVESHRFDLADGPKLMLTVSIGVATCDGRATASNELIQEADDALYQAKHGGRNRICVA